MIVNKDKLVIYGDWIADQCGVLVMSSVEVPSLLFWSYCAVPLSLCCLVVVGRVADSVRRDNGGKCALPFN